MSLGPSLPVFVFTRVFLPPSSGFRTLLKAGPQALQQFQALARLNCCFINALHTHTSEHLFSASLSKVIFFHSSHSTLIRFSRPGWMPFSCEDFPRQITFLPPRNSLTEPVIHTSLTVLITCGLTVEVHLISSLSILESETISYSFRYKQQGLAQYLEHSRYWVNTLMS